MTNKNFFKSILAVCLIAFTSVAAFISCEVGLGEAVDVAAPVIKIATPPTAAVIRDTFAIAGTWSDDGSIKSLEVTLKNTGTKKEYAVSGSFEQEANTKEFKGSWQAIVNPLDSSAPIPDGSYEATIKFSDYGSHTTTITKSFVIDNTPPIIVLTRPSTAADSLSSDTYGQTFTLEGQAADTNNVSLIEVEIYSDKDCTPESYLHTVPLLNVPNSINLDVAKFEKGDTTNDYFKIYKDATTDGGAKDFYCKLIAYDGAERYPVEGERSAADEKGNAISTYYLYKDIATEILQNYKINIVYNMLNGTYDEEDSSRSAVSDNVIAKLKEKVRTTGKFTLNPKNNPTFAVTGRSPLVLDGHDFDGVANNISDGSQVVIEVSPGLDGILLDEDSLKVYAIECDANGKAKAGASKIYPDTSKSESGTSYRFVTTINRDKGFEIDKTYIFGVEGYDQSTAKNPIEPASNGYGFRMAPSGKAPTLVVNTPESPAYVREGGVTKDGSVLKFSGTVAVEAGKPELKLYRGNNKTPIHEFNFENQTPQHVDREYVYTFEYECPDFTGSSAQSDFKLEASQSGNISEYKPTITVLYVKGEPTLKTTIKGPLVDADICPDPANTQNLDNINGNFDFEGTVSQKVGLYDVIDYDNSSWTFTGKDKNGAAKTETGDLAAAFAGKINTLNYKDKTTATLTIVVKDLAGNEKTETHQFFINQESDRPRFTAQNFDIAVTTEAELDLRVAKKKQNTLEEGVLTNMFSTSQVMKYTVEDDDGVKETKVKVGNGALQDADGFTLPDGKSQLTFYVYDTNYDSSKDATYNANYVYSFTVWVLKGQAPTVDIISTPDYVTTLDSNVASDAKKTFTVTGTVSGVGEYTLSYQDPDANNPGTHTIYYKLTSQEDSSYVEVAKGSDGLYHLYPEPAQGQTVEEAYKKSITWKDEFTPHNGSTSGTVQYTINGALNSTDKEFNFRVDSGRPTITFDAESVQAAGSTIYSTSYRFNGKAADSGISGLTKVEIQFTNKGGSPDESKWMAADGTGDWYKNIYFANGEFSCFTTQSEKTIHVRAKDGAGNYSTIYTKDFKYDTEYPTITINNKPNGYLPKGSYSLTGYITEKYGITSGTKLVVKEYLKVGSNYQLQDSAHDITITKGTGEDQYNYSWAMSIPFVSNLSGDLKYTFTISDANGNPLNADELLLTRDIVDPVVVISSPSSNTFGINSISGTSATLSGTVKEKDKDKLYYQIKSGTTAADSNWIEYDISDLANETDTWRVPIQLETSSYPDGKYILHVKAKDKAGNESTPVSQTFSIDRADPEVTVTVMKKIGGGNSTSVTETLFGSSTIKVKDGIGYDIQIGATDDSGIESIELYDITTTSSKLSLSDQGNKKITSNIINTEGTKSYKVIVKDKSGATTADGKTVTKTISVIYDKNDPTASITTIANDNDWISGTGKVYISGAATDNSGIKSIKMSLNGGTAKPVPVANPWTYELDCSSLTENTDATDSNYKLVLTVEDNCEKETTVTRYFKLDKTTPVIKNLSVKNATTGAFTTSIKNVKASGLAFDGAQTGYRPVIVTIEAKNASGTQADIGGTNKVITVTTGSTHDTTFGQFNQAVATKDLADGEYTFTIKATDYAGNTAEQEAVITVDKTKPSVTATSFTNWNTTKSGATINATFTETNPDAAYYYIDNGSDPSLTQETVDDADWVSMNIDGNTATKSCNFNDGKGKVYIKVVDKAGNVGYGTALDYAVDTKAPDVCTLESVKVKNGENDYTELTGTKLINGSKDLEITVYATDYNDNSDVLADDPEKIKSITLNSIGNTTITGISGVAEKDSNDKKTGKWTITIPSNKLPSAGGKVSVKVTDTFDNAKDFTSLVDLVIDQKAPRLLDNYSLTSTSAYDATAQSATSKTYYMNNVKYPFKLEGIAKDDLTAVNDGLGELEEVKLTLTGTVGGAAKTKTLTSSDSAWTFEIANDSAADAWKNWTGSVTGTLSVIDKAKNTGTSKTFTIIFDTTAPAALHKADGSGKDIYFRVGDQDRDDGITSINETTGAITATPTWSDSLDKDVGGKYKAGTFGNQETIKIRGNFEESGSGIAMIYYQLWTTEPTTTIINDFVTNPAVKAHGYFSPKETTRRVFYKGTISGVTAAGSIGSGDSARNYTSITSTYLTTLSGFKTGHNYLVLVAVDNVGNAAVDNISGNYYTINVDTQAPQTATFEDKYIDGKSALTLALDVTDNPSGENAVSAGIKSVTVKMDGVTEVKTAVKNDSTGKYEATIPVAQIPASGTYNVSVTAVDGAGKGNSDTRVVGSVIVDKTPPTVRITSTPDEWIKNSIGSISVSVNDVNGIKNDKISYNVYLSTDTSYSSSKANGTATITDGVATVNSITTSNTTNFVDGKSYVVRFTAEDIVGNKTYVTTNNFTVDRSIPTLTDADSGIGIGTLEVKTQGNVGNANTYFNGETLKVFGAYTDKAGSTVSGGTEITGSGVTEISYSLTPAGATTAITGSWPTTDGTYSSNLAGFKNGTNTLVLSAVDKMGNTSASTTYTIKVDTEAPVISEVNTNDFTAITLTNGTGTRTFEFNVADTGSGMNTTLSTITVKAGTNDIKNGVNGSTISVGALSNGKRKVTVKVGANDLIKLNGNNSVTAKVKDNAGNESNAERIGVLKVDKDAPVPSFTSHQANATVNKTITLGGSITDASNSAIKSIALTVTCGPTTKNYAYPTGTDGNITYANGQWFLSIDTNTAAYNNGTTAKAMSLSLKATDEADNESAAVTLALSIDQNSDRPVVKFTNLVKDDSGNYILKYGNDATLEGTITDDDSTSDKVVTKFFASESAITSADGWTAVSGKTNTWKHTITNVGDEQVEFNPRTGDFKYIPANKADGPKTVYFYVEDNTGAKFYTSQTTQLTRPKMQFKTDALNETANALALSYRSDSNAPKIVSVALNAYTAASGDNTQTGSSGLGSNCIVGGPSKKYVDINVTANDGNGIKGIVVILEQEGKDTIYYRSNTNVSETGVAATAYTTSTTVASSTSSADYTYATSRLDISDYDEAPVNVTIKVYDQSGLYSNQESMFVVDNTAPTLTIENFEDGDVVYGIKKNTVGGTINGATDVEKIYYAVTKDKVNNAAVASDSIAAANWIEVTGQKISAKIIFGGTNADSATGQIDKSLRQYLMDIYEHDEDYMLANDDNLGLAIHFKAVDACGNTGYSKRTLEVVPNGDKPTITLTYPVDLTVNGTLTNPSLAGTIRVYGNAEVAEGNVAAVYVQIDTNYNGTSFNASGWETGFNTCISGKGTTYTVEKIGNSTLRGVKATGTLNWNLPINGNKEFNPTGTSRPMAIRIYGVGGSGKVSEYVEQVFTVDPNAPHIGGDGSVSSVMQLKLVQFSSTPTTGDTAAQAQAKIVKQMPYKSGAWVTGQWYIAASVYDDSGIRSITLDQNDGYDKIKIVDGTVKQDGNNNTQAAYTRKNQANYQQIIVKDNNCSAAINNVTGKSNFDIYIPLPTTEGCGSVNFTIEAVEVAENANSSTENIKISYDNTPPKLGTVGHDSYNANAYNVCQDNGFYRIFGYATDTEEGSVVSDMKAVAFYFVRRGTANTRVYDPMWKNKYVAIDGTDNTKTISYEYGMFWNTKTVGREEDLSKLTLAAKDDNIHAGGFVLIEGTIYTIREVSSDGLTITLKTEAPANITTAKFAYAMVIDNFDMTESTDGRQKETDSTKYGYGYYKADSTADDGDLMQEKWASGKWEAWINSNNIPDGPIEIHYVALDNAQNYSVGIVGNLSWNEYHNMTNKTLDVTANGDKATATDGLISGFDYIYDANKKAYVSNNAPRIAGVTVGTDYNGNGTVETTEKQTKYVELGTRLFNNVANSSSIIKVLQQFNASSDGTASGLPFMRVVDSTDVEIEIIGGNNEMYYRYHITENCDDTATFTNGTYGTGKSSWQISRTAGEGYKTDDDGHQGYYTTTKLPAINFTNAQLKSAIGGDNGTNGTRWFTIQIWDSTEETTHFVNSQYAELKLPLNVEVLDGTRPNTVISPLYWKSATDNSVYRNVNDELFGHIELIKDIGSSQLGTTYGTTDDKVSGVVVFRGFAYDNKRLAQLDWAIVDSNGKSILPNATSGVSYNAGSTFSSTGWSTGGDLAYNSTTKKVTGTYKFTVKTAAEDGAYLDEKGHKVAWELAVDTSAISGIVAKDAKLYVRAKDNSGSTATQYTDMTATGSPAAGVTDQEAIDKATKKPTYQVDILPYITKITTRMAKKDTTNPEVYSRTAKGHYPIASDETTAGSVVLHGYNLAASNADVDISAGMGSRESGAYAYTVSGSITTINNMNNNDAHGDYDLTTEGLAERTKVANMYNRQPNTSTNLKLTDDVYFDMWELNNNSATSGSALRYPVMHINPSNNQIGFGFVRGSDSVSFPANGNSYIWYQKNRKDYIGTNFVYDSNGVAHNVSIGLDAQFDTGIAGRMLYNNSNWYAGNNAANRIKQWDKRYSIALESIGIPNGVYVKGVNTNVSGGQGIIDIDRFTTPAIAASAHSSGTAVYIIYYDSDHDQIRFRYGEVPLTGANRTDTQYGLLNDSKSEHQRHGTATQSTTNNTQIASDTSDQNDTWASHGMFEASKSYYALVTGKYYNQSNDGLGGTAGTLRTDTGNNGSAYYAIGVVPGNTMNNDKVVMVWFDQVANKLMYMYRMNLGTNANASNRDASVNGVDDVWSKPEAIYSGALQDCVMAVDINGGIHIAAYDQNNANLLYMYKQTYSTSGVVSCVVDSYSQIGTKLSIDTALNSNNKVVPYISYFAEGLSSLPKLAYLPDGITTTSATTIAASIKNGADASTNLFTGDWEVSMIPTSSKLQNGAGYNVSIGVFKDKTTGKVGQAFKPAKTTDVVTDQDTRKRYANGTTELVLGYGIKNNGVGYIETAMRK